MTTDTAISSFVGAFGYPDFFSVLPGETLVLHLSSTAASVGVRVYSLTQYASNAASEPIWVSAPLLDLGRVPVSLSLLQPNNTGLSGINDWDWPANVDVNIPSMWETGIYIAEIAAYASGSSTTQLMTSWVMFVVKNPSPTPGARMLYKWNINTIQAYSTALFPIAPANASVIPSFDNDFYENPACPTGSSAFKVTLRRPVTTMWDVKGMTYDYPMVMWLQQQGYAVDYCTDVDVELDTNLSMLSNYPCLLLRGHDEYLGAQTYQNLTNYRNHGGNIAFLTGNTCCWQVTYGDVVNGIPTSFTCDKGPYHVCDINGPDAWWVLGQYDNKLVGVGSRNAAIYSPDIDGPFTIPTGGMPTSPGYKVQNSDHWIFAGTGLENGDVIGNGNVSTSEGQAITENLIGYEAGGARLDDDLELTHTDGTPANFALLGVAVTAPYQFDCNAPAGWTGWVAFSREGMANPPGDVSGVYAATMGYYSAYGQVFAATTIHWVMILNEWNYDGNYYQDEPGSDPYPAAWPPPKDAKGNPILGNPYLHTITRNVLSAFMVQAKSVVAVGDLNGDGQPDLVLQSTGSGEPAFWLMNGTSMSSSGSIIYDGSSAPGTLLRIVGMGSLTSATSTDLVLQDQTTGAMYYWTLQYSNGTLLRTAVAALVPSDVPGNLTYKAALVTDLNGDGHPDILFQNQQDGSLWCWLLDGTTLVSSEKFVSAYMPGNVVWVPVTAIDINGDGASELIFQDQSDMSLYYWTMQGTTRTGDGSITGPAAPGVVVGSGFFAGPGVPAILFQAASNGDLSYWTIVDDAQSGSGAFTPATPWWLGS